MKAPIYVRACSAGLSATAWVLETVAVALYYVVAEAEDLMARIENRRKKR